MSDIKWGTIIPLIGGSAIGCSLSTKNKPQFHLSYNAFSDNETSLMNYWNDVPKYMLDDGNVVDFKEVDFVNSVCPCAGLSMLNTSKGESKGRGGSAAQNQWMYNSAEYVLSNVQPRVFWGENAPGLFTKIGTDVVYNLKEIAKKYNYSFSLYKTNSELHGIPQRRIRTFYFFWKSPTAPIMNWKNTPAPDLLTYLNQIPADAPNQNDFMVEGLVTEHYLPYKFLLEKLDMTHEEFYTFIGRGTINQYLQDNDLLNECIDWLKEHYPNHGFSNRDSTRTFIDMLEHIKVKLAQGLGYWDASPHFFDTTFAALIGRNMFNGVHPVENRYLNIREMLHLMGMPHDFQLNDVRKVNHIAQNVPVKTAKDMTDEVVKFLNGELPLSDSKFVRQDNMTQKISTEQQVHAVF